MNTAYLGATLLLLAGCTSAEAFAIDPSDDLHCAVLIRTLEKNADQLGATSAVKSGLYVLQTWYFAKIEPERLREAQRVVEAIKKNPAETASVSRICSNRAFSDPGFSSWKSIVSSDYEQQAKR